MEDFAPMIGSVAIMVVLGWIAKVISNNRRTLRMATMQADLQSKLLDKFGSTPELLGYLQSDAGKNFGDLVPVAVQSTPYDKILSSVQTGIVSLTVGVACLFVRDQISDGFEGFTLLGALGIALGVGFLLSAGIAFLLSKKWGVINGGRAASLSERV